MSFTTATVLNVITRLRMMNRSWAWSPPLSSVVLLLGLDHGTGMYYELSWSCFKTTLFPLLLWFVITSFKLWCDVKLCSVWNVVICDGDAWSCTILVVWLVESRSFEISSDYRVYMGSSPLAWLPQRSLIHLNSYKLDGSVTAGIRARLNI